MRSGTVTGNGCWSNESAGQARPVAPDKHGWPSCHPSWQQDDRSASPLTNSLCSLPGVSRRSRWTPPPTPLHRCRIGAGQRGQRVVTIQGGSEWLRSRVERVGKPVPSMLFIGRVDQPASLRFRRRMASDGCSFGVRARVAACLVVGSADHPQVRLLEDQRRVFAGRDDVVNVELFGGSA